MFAFAGCCRHEDSQERPEFPPTGILNDAVTGYLGAAGMLAALIRRATEGGSYHVKLSLARCSGWYPTLGLLHTDTIDFGNAAHRRRPRTVSAPNPAGRGALSR